jgi:predicted nucleotidyltransferase
MGGEWLADCGWLLVEVVVVMLPLIEEHQGELFALCREFGIERLEIFGSASTGAFDPDRSDLDFIVTYPEGYDLGPWMKRHFEFKDRLEQLFSRKVDLIEAGATRNPYVLRSMEQSKQEIYALESSGAAVGGA